MTVRVATVEDAGAIGSVHVRSWQSAYRGIVADATLDALSVERRAAYWAGLVPQLEERGQALWVCELGERVCGFACAGPCRDPDQDAARVGELQAIYLEPEVWSRGLGRALHAEVVAWLGARSFGAATLWVARGNERAIAFYERNGWRADGATKEESWDGAAFFELRYRREL